MCGVGEAERTPGVSTGPREVDAVTVRPQPLMRHTVRAGAVDRDEGIDARSAVTKQVLDPAQVAEPLFTDGTYEENVSGGADVRLIHGPQYGQHRGQPARVVADARSEQGVSPLLDTDIGAFGEYGIEVARQCEHRPVSRSSAQSEGVTLFIDPSRVDAEVDHLLQEALAAHLFHERGRWNLGEFDEIGDRGLVAVFDQPECLLDAGVGQQALNLVIPGICALRLCRRGLCRPGCFSSRARRTTGQNRRQNERKYGAHGRWG